MTNEDEIEIEKETVVDTELVDEIYKLYPTSSKGRPRIGKSLKDKKKIGEVLKTGYPLKLAVEVVKKEDYPKDLAAFLNALPDPDTLKTTLVHPDFPIGHRFEHEDNIKIYGVINGSKTVS
jgi:hypothetical protein